MHFCSERQASGPACIAGVGRLPSFCSVFIHNAYLNKTILYTYDTGGNLLTKTEYPYTTGTPGTATATHTYAYGNAAWTDELTGYDGNAVTYDAIGNPLSYYNGYTFTWQHGRQLATASNGTNTVSYRYDSSGVRTAKTVNGVTTRYYLDGSTIVWQTDGTNTIHYTYDADGQVVFMTVGGQTYYYERNGQGDVAALVDSTGSEVVKYTYDTWGKVRSVTGTLANTIGQLNPFRYRGYYYDAETGLYYLQSRYYDPGTGRFINADGDISTETGFLGFNMFSYCNNNPVSMVDSWGLRPMGINPDRETLAERTLSFAALVEAQKTTSGPVDTKSPPPKETGYIPPKNPDKIKQKTRAPGARGETGWLDSKGNVWVPDNDMDGGPGWRRHYPDGNHDHVCTVRSHSHFSWDPIIGAGMVCVSAVAVVWIVGDGTTVLGVADDAALLPIATFLGKGWEMIIA